MRCIIIDDEPLALELLEDNIKYVDGLQLVASCRSAAQAMQVMHEQQIDLIFCDIQMPGITGLQLVKSMVQKPLVIFITAYNQFAVDGFELDVVDYLLKPVPLERFLKACSKAQTIFDQQRRLANDIAGKNRDHLFVYADYNLVRLSHHEITHIEGLKDYVKLYREGQPKPLLSRMTIKALEEQLPADRFYRTHKSFIVNLDHVQSIRKGRIKIGTAEVPYSDNYRDVIGRMTGKAV
ncbi:response regulator transcription factor [Mucilaginibacter sp. JRF]|uniref:LytR/AlgR family response regulator transcription factor n=1 Tax=Mucilaginibacter sp. JRF TaxID=2780088 RepID=UPI00187FEC2B|nr:LytTR family DNA-binding domain-containing protein [Mucilaginibacter sp. JRF]MBE9583417.1 response regulator transcription factor [Mucilaginibacter sp. JRF]